MSEQLAHPLNRLEDYLLTQPEGEIPVITHRLTPGLYTREAALKAATDLERTFICTSWRHRTTHQFILSKGRCRVWMDGMLVEIAAPYHGVTLAGTRRAVAVLEDAVWTTFHPTTITSLDDLEALEHELFDKHVINFPEEALA